MAKTGENLKAWEAAYLGEKILPATSIFWQCVVAVAFVLTFGFILTVRLQARRPALFAYVWVGFSVLIVAVTYSSSDFMVKAAKTSALLRESKNLPGYDEVLRSARALTLRFFVRMMVLGVAIAAAWAIFEAR